MEIKFQVRASDFNATLDTVSVVTPRVVSPKGGAGYLCIVSANQCYVYSRDGVHMSRANIEVEVEGEETSGSFIYPSDYVKGFKFLGDEMVTITATDSEGNHAVAYTTGSKANVTHPTFDPQLITPIDKDFDDASNDRVYPVALLQEALKTARSFVADSGDTNASEENRTIQLFDASKEEFKAGNGTLFASNGLSACYFFTEAFKDKGLTIHAQTLRGVTEFLGGCESEVRIRTSNRSTFAVNEKGGVYGWGHQTKSYGKYSYYALDLDKVVLTVPVVVVLNALRYLESEMGKGSRKIKVEYSSKTKEITFRAADGGNKATSFPVPAEVKEDNNEDVVFNANIEHFLGLFSGAKGKEVQLRIFPHEGGAKGKPKTLVRTIDEFILDKDGKLVGGSGGDKPEGSHPCLVTRFLVSMA